VIRAWAAWATAGRSRQSGGSASEYSAGPGAVLSYQTAAELQGLADKPDDSIHVTVPRERHVLAAEGISEDEILKDFKQWRGGKRK